MHLFLADRALADAFKAHNQTPPTTSLTVVPVRAAVHLIGSRVADAGPDAAGTATPRNTRASRTERAIDGDEVVAADGRASAARDGACLTRVVRVRRTCSARRTRHAIPSAVTDTARARRTRRQVPRLATHRSTGATADGPSPARVRRSTPCTCRAGITRARITDAAWAGGPVHPRAAVGAHRQARAALDGAVATRWVRVSGTRRSLTARVAHAAIADTARAAGAVRLRRPVDTH